MSLPQAPTPPPNPTPAAQIAEARDRLRSLRDKLGHNPELEEAIEKLELALSALTIQTGGLL